MRFSGDLQFSAERLQSRVRTVPNRRFLGIRGFTWWRWLYQAGEANTFGRRLGRALMDLGEPPARLDLEVLASDVQQLRLFYQREGFRQADVEARVDTTADGQGADITIAIKAGPPTMVRLVSYSGLDSLTAEHRTQLLTRSALISDEGAARRRFSELELLDERRYLLTNLRDIGYAAVTRDSIAAIVTPAPGDSFDVEFRISPGPRFRFGPVHFVVDGPDDAAATRADTLQLPDSDGGLITFHIEGDPRLKQSLLLRALQAYPGHWFNQGQLLTTKRRLEATGVFTLTDIASLSPAGGRLPHRITVRVRPRHQFRLETFVLQSSGVLGGVGNELGAGLGVTYENANLFGNGEGLRLSGTGSVATDVDTTFFSSAVAEVSATMTLPYLVWPFRYADTGAGLFQTRSIFSVSYLTARREDVRLIIRGRGSARIRQEFRHTPTITSTVDLFDLSLSQPDTLQGFQTRFLDRIFADTLQVVDPVQRAQILEDYTQPQINNAIRYTFRSETANPLRRDAGYSYEAAIEIGGNLPYMLDRYVSTPSVTEGSLQLLSGTSSRVNYRQYFRIVGDFRKYYQMGTSGVLALKFVGGWAQPVGGSTVVPFDRRFYSGGASSVRGWRLRQLGPGTASFSDPAARGAAATNLLGGDIKLESSIELRQTVLRSRLGADWIFALFTDAGNVWFGPRHPGFPATDQDSPTGRFLLRRVFRETGLGSGLGLRIGWPYLIARVDVAWRVYDPAVPEQGLLPNGFSSWVAYFRFGHAF
ncbi:MAG: BamA/TamA family outer membrane protein [Bacteroidota bacterium]|nr:BamA/TamA family outer membrane protein [Bacteroidota bacterium]